MTHAFQLNFVFFLKILWGQQRKSFSEIYFSEKFPETKQKNHIQNEWFQFFLVWFDGNFSKKKLFFRENFSTFFWPVKFVFNQISAKIHLIFLTNWNFWFWKCKKKHFNGWTSIKKDYNWEIIIVSLVDWFGILQKNQKNQNKNLYIEK